MDCSAALKPLSSNAAPRDIMNEKFSLLVSPSVVNRNNTSWYSRILLLSPDTDKTTWLAWANAVHQLFLHVHNIASKLLWEKKVKIGKQAVEFDHQLYTFYSSAEVISAFKDLPSHLQPTRLQAVSVFDIVQRCFKVRYKQRCSAVASIQPIVDVESEDFRREVDNFPGWAHYGYSRVMNRKLATLKPGKALTLAELTVDKLKLLSRKKKDTPNYGNIGALSKFQTLLDEGGLTYLRTEFGEYATALLLLIRSSIVKDELSDTCIKEGWETIVRTPSLSRSFLRAYEQTCGRPLSDTDWIVADNIFDAITRKVYHARLNVVVRDFQLTQTGRTGDKEASDSLRVQLRQGSSKSDATSSSASSGEKKASVTEDTKEKKKKKKKAKMTGVQRRDAKLTRKAPFKPIEKALPNRTYYRPQTQDITHTRSGCIWWPHLPVPQFVPSDVTAKIIYSQSFIDNLYRLYGPQNYRPKLDDLE